MNYSWPQLLANHLIYEDDHLLVLNKPVGLTVMGGQPENDLLSIAKMAKQKIYPVHRIDKVTSGLVLFAKVQSTQAQLARLFAKRQIKKSYLAITKTHSNIKANGKAATNTLTNWQEQAKYLIDLPLCKGRKNRVRVAGQRRDVIFTPTTNSWSVPSDKIYHTTRYYPAQTAVKCLRQGKQHSLLHVKPTTGRTHQIRVHLAWVGFPILGDPLFTKFNKQNATSRIYERTYLHAWKLQFPTTWRTEADLNLISPAPGEFWKRLNTPLQDL